MVEISLIPKKEKQLIGLSSLFFNSGMILLVLAVFVSATMFFYKRNLEKKFQELALVQKDIESKRDIVFEKNVLAVKQDLNAAKKLLDIHLAPTKIFKLLEEIAYPKTQFLSASIDFGRNAISLEAMAQNFEALDAQRSVLSGRKDLEKFEISNIGLEKEGEIRFTINLYLAPDFLMYNIQ